MLSLIPFESFSMDADALERLGKQSVLPVIWLSVCQIAFRFAETDQREREELASGWIANAAEDGQQGILSYLPKAGHTVTDFQSMVRATAEHIDDMLVHNAVHLAFATACNLRLAVFNGPADLQALTLRYHIRALRQMGYDEEADDLEIE
jgi:hypothetical protein